MSQRNESLKSYNLRSPVAPLQRDRGNWKWSVLCASLFNEAQGDVSQGTFADDTTAGVNLFLFLHDAPAAIQASQVYSSVALADEILAGYTCSPSKVVNASASVLVTDASNVPVEATDGEAIKGYTATNDVRVSGYAITVSPNQAVSTGGNSADLSVCVHANSPVIEGRTAFNDGDDVAIPAILRESDYTQDIRDAGNIVVDSGTGTIYEIVGLYGLVTP